MPDIVLTTFNARYAHTAFGLRYLMANLGELKPRAAIVEFDIAHRPVDAIETILAMNPKIVGIGVYIWNVQPATQLVTELKRLRPNLTIVIGGPEVSYEQVDQPICDIADYVIAGEADLAFAELCESLLSGRRPLMKFIQADLPEFESKAGRAMALPYALYDDRDVKQRVIYVEASRGCPFKCEFCLSSLDVPVRNVPTGEFLQSMDDLLRRGVLQFKFVDRTFNLNLNISSAILNFFLDRLCPGLFLHFEMIPDRLPEALRSLIAKFPAGMLQFEVGVQTLNGDVARRISRKQDVAKLADNLKFLREHTGVHVHADLIVGLPGETLQSFAAGFDRLVAMGPQEIQVGILKRLRGTPIVRHDAEFAMVYSPHPPYEVLQTGAIDFSTMQRLRRFARFWDLLANSGNFVDSVPLLWQNGSPFACFMELSDALFAKVSASHGIALQRLTEMLFDHLRGGSNVDPQVAADTIWRDYQRGGRSDRPRFLAEWVQPADTRAQRTHADLPARQRRHAAINAASRSSTA